MSTHSHSHGHGHGHGADHVPHVLPLSTYLKTGGSLFFLTAITVAASYVDFGSANLWIALLIASVKASIVALIFMHLLYDKKFNAVIFVVGLLFMGVFIAFTMLDTEARGQAENIEAERPANIQLPFQSTRSEEALKAKWTPASEKAEEKKDEAKGEASPTEEHKPAH